MKKIFLTILLCFSLVGCSTSNVTVLVGKEEKIISKTLLTELTKDRNSVKGEYPSGEPLLSFVYKQIEYKIYKQDKSDNASSYLLTVDNGEMKLNEIPKELLDELILELKN